MALVIGDLIYTLYEGAANPREFNFLPLDWQVAFSSKRIFIGISAHYALRPIWNRDKRHDLARASLGCIEAVDENTIWKPSVVSIDPQLDSAV